MWSPTYFAALFIVVIMIVAGLCLYRKLKEKQVRAVLFSMATFTISTEIVKMIFTGLTYGIERVEFTPLYFCSSYMYALVFSLCKNEKLRQIGLTFLFFGGIVGAAAFFLYPSACIPNYPIYHFMCIRTMLYHGSMIYTGIIIVLTGCYKPDISHYKNYLAFLGTIGAGAYIINTLSDGKYDYMYISKPLKIDFIKEIYNAIPNLYPFIALALQLTVPFFATYLVYYLIKKYSTKGLKNVHT